MLTDIFAERYAGRGIWKQYTGTESKLLMQCYRIVAEQIMPPWWVNGKESKTAKAKWTSVSNRLTMELGIDELERVRRTPDIRAPPVTHIPSCQVRSQRYQLSEDSDTLMSLEKV